jgi:hypothetical protein
MFVGFVESTAVGKKSNASWGMIVSASVETLILGILMMIPLVNTQALPGAFLPTLLVAPSPPPHRVVAMVNVKPVVHLIQGHWVVSLGRQYQSAANQGVGQEQRIAGFGL